MAVRRINQRKEPYLQDADSSTSYSLDGREKRRWEVFRIQCCKEMLIRDGEAGE